MALTETSFGLGLMIGPALGSLLFEAGGFKLPFFVVGGFACVVALILPIALARVEAVPGLFLCQFLLLRVIHFKSIMLSQKLVDLLPPTVLPDLIYSY